LSESKGVTLLAVMLLAACAILVAHGAWRRRSLLGVQPQIAPSHRAIALTAILAFATALTGVASLLTSN